MPMLWLPWNTIPTRIDCTKQVAAPIFREALSRYARASTKCERTPPSSQGKRCGLRVIQVARIRVAFYLMRVSQRFESHRELWFSDSVPVKAKQAKSANSDIFGDIYQPLSELGDPYSQESYLPPCKCHSHCEPGDWGRDIGYLDRYGRIPSLLVGDPEYSFLWDKPTIRSPFKPSRALPKVQLSKLFPLA